MDASATAEHLLADGADTVVDVPGAQTSYAGELISELQERGHLRLETAPAKTSSTADLQQAPRALIAREAERLAQLAAEIHHRLNTPAQEDATHIMLPSEQPHQVPRPGW